MAVEDARKAVKLAYDYLLSVSTNPSSLSNFRLEELQTEKGGTYLITLSYDVVGDFSFDKKRELKVFKVNKTATKVLSMTIRKV